MHELLLDICKRKIDNGMSYEDILKFIKANKTENMFHAIQERVKAYIEKVEKEKRSNIA